MQVSGFSDRTAAFYRSSARRWMGQPRSVFGVSTRHSQNWQAHKVYNLIRFDSIQFNRAVNLVVNFKLEDVEDSKRRKRRKRRRSIQERKKEEGRGREQEGERVKGADRAETTRKKLPICKSILFNLS
ncbi:hypothetical protein TWF569_005141 [Orbilia oligospora]|uniref:Uncharacterized protein n=1 Tax=Orbilia oligospora TaxID=2813651 RepID=A0A7C8NJP9_ORBOL|nr:hypothetical protein TWF706_005284 [Orbilia oligospora]KAF3108668.1 hypothetical protein TWF102_010790 [Orbilia oligospora]KAF3109994.1 hypothetical protein TWF103_004824 [Orbilia oligospora]KAF3149528.1 hypothetical protein TWF569_005141 [Orbilia oligospora]